MATVKHIETKRIQLTDNRPRDDMNNEISSTSSESSTSDPITKFNNFYRSSYIQSQSDSEGPPRRSVQLSRNHYKSMGNINDMYTEVTSVQNSISNIDLNLHSTEIKKFEALRIPIVGYEVMEERARFTIYKLKVEDDKRDQSWLVFRRYTDFVRLYNRVKNQQPNLMLPLPGKRWFRDNFEPAFLEERVRGLQIFVNAVLSKLPNHPVVREFFCLDEPPQVFSYQPEVQAVYGALEDSISTMKVQLKQKDATIMHLQKRVGQLEDQVKNCPTCSTNKSACM
ncbi:sorting nexin-16 [Pararge aegeria]|uniref:Jg21457 protein n=3 Tax=Pararge aegeria TaxID=116150 RepID=A0A8S4RM27_9NEOP|nr:sorting nexin-16 [Pararge aegeria]XP_039762754.1 sorting nexin-16 [Pararge aegeria]XP_039762755.1 sorting nexin-16 [Pararge aegeria]XP_039762756.1 sorting nexin-16 [Pararge aegeria]CAH2237867.1 jg21457 [Pararge aegeria aegeria]